MACRIAHFALTLHVPFRVIQLNEKVAATQGSGRRKNL
jgi:hypothetical protein